MIEDYHSEKILSGSCDLFASYSDDSPNPLRSLSRKNHRSDANKTAIESIVDGVTDDKT